MMTQQSNTLPIISLRDATIYQDVFPILKNVTFEIHGDAFVFLVGKTGSGKTSLLKTLYADLPLKAGKGTLADVDLSAITEEEVPMLRRKLGIIFQDFQLLTDRNVVENLWFALRATGWKNKAIMQQKIDKVLTEVNLTWAYEKMIHQLSGGEQQRVAIARALLNDPVILLADEPTGNLDQEAAYDTLSLLVDINQRGTAVLMTTHNRELVQQHPARLLHCKDGSITTLDSIRAIS